MIYSISHIRDVSVYRKDKLFMLAKRKYGLSISSTFYIQDKPILKTSAFAIALYKRILIKYQNLLNYVMIEKKTDHFHLFSNGHEYYIDMSSRNLLPKPKYSCYLNGERLGTIEAKHFAQLGGQEYIMESFANDETHDINFQLLFISQLHNIG